MDPSLVDLQLACAAVEPLVGVLCADAAAVGQEEACRASKLLASLVLFGGPRVGAVCFFTPADDLLFARPWKTRNSALGLATAKLQSGGAEFKREDALVIAHAFELVAVFWTKGCTLLRLVAEQMCAEAVSEIPTFIAIMGIDDSITAPSPGGTSDAAAVHTLCAGMTGLLREPRRAPSGSIGSSGVPDAAAAGCWALLYMLSSSGDAGAEATSAAIDAGLFDVAATELRRWRPAEWMSSRNNVAGVVMGALNSMTQCYPPKVRVNIASRTL